MSNKPSFGPKCPNHNEFLEGIAFPMPEEGIGMCPVSGASFEFKIHVDEENTQVDKFGNITKVVGWSVEGKD